MLEKILKLKRSKTETLLNDPWAIEVGGYSSGKTKKIVNLREPNLEVLGKHLAMIRVGLSGFLSENEGFLAKAMTDPKSLSPDDVISFSTIPAAAVEIIADIVGEDTEYVTKEMHGKETVVVLERYLELIGWDLIAKTFIQAWQSWSAAAAKATKTGSLPKVPKPPRSAGHSSRSAAS